MEVSREALDFADSVEKLESGAKLNTYTLTFKDETLEKAYTLKLWDRKRVPTQIGLLVMVIIVASGFVLDSLSADSPNYVKVAVYTIRSVQLIAPIVFFIVARFR